jgi:anaerobic magnesium-protoporphyrin IX monomethyl ester cyclase
VTILLVGPDYEENLSIRYLSASLLAAGHETILATFNSPIDTAAVVNTAQSADLVGLSICFQARAPEFLDLARRLKQTYPGKIIVAGGHYASCAGQELLANHPELDLIVIHEGERTLVEIAGAVPNLDEHLPGIAGIAYRDGNGVRLTAPRPTLEDLDTLPYADRRGPIHRIAGVPTSYLMGSRGCYSNCAYCCITTLHRLAPGKRFRQRNVERVADEMATLYHGRGTRQFIFHDDNFLVPSTDHNHARISALEAALQQRGVRDIALAIKFRPADADRDVLQRLRELGLIRVFLGVEAATPRGLAALERCQEVEDSVRALETCRALDISAQFTLMTFNPDTSIETLRADIAFMRRFSANPLNFCRTEIYAGTPLEQRMIEAGRARGDYRARAYNLPDPVTSLVWETCFSLFRARCWHSAALMQNAIGIDHAAAVLKHFYRGRRRDALAGRAAKWLRAVNLDTIGLLEEIVELSVSAGGHPDRWFQRAIEDLAARESTSRERYMAEARELRVSLQALQFKERTGRESGTYGWSRFAKPAAAAVLAIGIPAALEQPAIAQQQQPAGPAQAAIGSFTGRILDMTGAGVSYAKVTATNADTGAVRSAKADKGGEYAIGELRPGKYTLTAESEGFSMAVRSNLILKVGARERIDLSLIVALGSCEMVAAAVPEPVRIDDRLELLAGLQSASKLPGGTQLPQPPAPPLAPQVPGNCSLTGHIVDPSGADVPGANVSVISADTNAIRSTISDKNGIYTVGGLAAGRYTIEASSPGYKKTVRTDLVLKAGACERIDIGLTLYLGCCETVAISVEPPRVFSDLYEHRKPFTYVVGDSKDHGTFEGIALLAYGDRRKWLDIFEANSQALGDLRELPAGTVLYIPRANRPIPKLIHKVLPSYPPDAKAAGIWGNVALEVSLAEDGSVDITHVAAGDPLLVKAAIAAVQQWRYRPRRVRGVLMDMFMVGVSFGKDGKVR